MMKEAAAAAMIYLITEDNADLARALDYLRHANRFLRYCLDVDMAVVAKLYMNIITDIKLLE